MILYVRIIKNILFRVAYQNIQSILIEPYNENVSNKGIQYCNMIFEIYICIMFLEESDSAGVYRNFDSISLMHFI